MSRIARSGVSARMIGESRSKISDRSAGPMKSGRSTTGARPARYMTLGTSTV